MKGLYILVLGSCFTYISEESTAENGQQYELKCEVNSITQSVSFDNPCNSNEGQCLAPLGGSPGACNPNMAQDLGTGTTTITLPSFLISSHHGCWKCIHGTNVKPYCVQGIIIPSSLTQVSTNSRTFTINTDCAFPVAKMKWQLVDAPDSSGTVEHELSQKDCTPIDDGTCATFTGCTTVAQNATKYSCSYTVPDSVDGVEGTYYLRGSVVLSGQYDSLLTSSNHTFSTKLTFEECCPTICCPQWCLLMYFISMAVAAAICLVPIWTGKWKVKKTWIKKGLAILISVAVVIFAIITGVAFGIDASKNGSACAIDCSGLGSNCPCKLNAFLIGLLGLIEIPFAIWFVKYHTEVNKDTEDESAAAGEDNENGCPKKCKGMMSSSSCCPLNTIHCSSDDDNNTTIKNIPDEKTDAEISSTAKSNRLPAITQSSTDGQKVRASHGQIDLEFVEGKKKKKKKKNKNQEPSKTSHRDLPSLPENTDPLPPIKK